MKTIYARPISEPAKLAIGTEVVWRDAANVLWLTKTRSEAFPSNGHFIVLLEDVPNEFCQLRDVLTLEKR